MANLVVLVVVILGLINGGYCQETDQEAPWRIHTLFSVECHNYLFRSMSPQSMHTIILLLPSSGIQRKFLP
ncbi:hypothetical protein CsSME_00022914 [Camellia sinensis var. sinensis]